MLHGYIQLHNVKSISLLCEAQRLVSELVAGTIWRKHSLARIVAKGQQWRKRDNIK